MLTKTNATDAALSESYTYDAANRLPATSGGGRNQRTPGREGGRGKGQTLQIQQFLDVAVCIDPGSPCFHHAFGCVEWFVITRYNSQTGTTSRTVQAGTIGTLQTVTGENGMNLQGVKPEPLPKWVGK